MSDVDPSTFALGIMHAAYDIGIMLEKMAPNPEYQFAVRALSTAAFGACQAIMCVYDDIDDYDYDPLLDLHRRLINAETILTSQRTAASSLAGKEVARARMMLARVVERIGEPGVPA
jgi:hypothetical protein